MPQGSFEIARSTRDRTNVYESDSTEEIVVSDGCFSLRYLASESADDRGARRSGVEDVGLHGDEVRVRHADGRAEGIPLPTRGWLWGRTALLAGDFPWTIHDDGLAALAGSPLEQLDLTRSAISREGYAHLGRLPSLRRLVLPVYAPAEVLPDVARASTLEELVLPAAMTPPPAPEGLLAGLAARLFPAPPPLAPLSRLPRLKRLVLPSEATGAWLEDVDTLCALEDLSLHLPVLTRPRLEAGDLQRLHTCQALRRLDLTGCDAEPEALAELRRRLPECDVVA